MARDALQILIRLMLMHILKQHLILLVRARVFLLPAIGRPLRIENTFDLFFG